MRFEDKENASPQLAPPPEGTKIPSKGAQQLSKPSPLGVGAKNRFGFTPSPPGGGHPKHSSIAAPSPVASSAKELIKELGAADPGNPSVCDESLGPAPSSKELLVQLQTQSIPGSPAHADDLQAGPTAFTLHFTPIDQKKLAKKPVLAERKPAERKPAAAKPALPKAPARRSMEKPPAAVAPPKMKAAAAPLKGKAVEKKAVGVVKAVVGKVRRAVCECAVCFICLVPCPRLAQGSVYALHGC